VGIEAKKYNTPDWMQCVICYDKQKHRWSSSLKSKIPEEARVIFNGLVKDFNFPVGAIPPFIENPLTHEEWIKFKQKTKNFNDIYLEIPSGTISKLYRSKGCHYIQISNGFGLYHLGEDLCNFNVPMFCLEERLRVRIKVHARKKKNGFCSLSVTVACQPKNIKTLTRSPYSLDNKNLLPLALTWSPK